MHGRPMKKIALSFTLIIFPLFLFVTNLFGDQEYIYDLVYRAEPLKNGKIFFLRFRNPLLDPVLKTYEIYLFDPSTGQISFLQNPQEKLYILPVLSRDRSTMSYHSLIEGTDYMVTANLETGRSVRLRFDTGGYFVEVGIDYDNDTVAASIKRGENRQAIYLISNSRGTIRRILDGKVFRETGFLSNGNVYFVERDEHRHNLGFVNPKTKEKHIIADSVELVQKTPNGDAILYSRKGKLYLYRPYGNESLVLSENFDEETVPPLISMDGSTCAVIDKGIIYIVNIPSGDVLYYVSIDTRGLSYYLTDYTFYIVKEKKIFYIEHKKPGGSLQELYEAEDLIHLLAVSKNDRQLFYRHDDKTTVIIYERKKGTSDRNRFDFEVEQVIPPDSEDGFYVITRSTGPEWKYPVRELYYYHTGAGKLLTVSTARDTYVELYRNKEQPGMHSP